MPKSPRNTDGVSGTGFPLTSTTLQTNGSGNWVFDIVGTFASSRAEPGQLHRGELCLFG